MVKHWQPNVLSARIAEKKLLDSYNLLDEHSTWDRKLNDVKWNQALMPSEFLLLSMIEQQLGTSADRKSKQALEKLPKKTRLFCWGM